MAQSIKLTVKKTITLAPDNKEYRHKAPNVERIPVVIRLSKQQEDWMTHILQELPNKIA